MKGQLKDQSPKQDLNLRPLQHRLDALPSERRGHRFYPAYDSDFVLQQATG